MNVHHIMARPLDTFFLWPHGRRRVQWKPFMPTTHPRDRSATGKMLGLTMSLLSFMAVAVLGLAWLGAAVGARCGHRRGGALAGALLGFFLGLHELWNMVRAIERESRSKDAPAPGP